MKTGILLVNLGTPKSPSVRDVKNYLTEFLMDERVIDLPFIKRSLLVKGVIVPFRASKVAKEYKKLWLSEGSPLLVYGRSLKDKLNELFKNENTVVELAMRYQNPSIKQGLERLRESGAQQLIIFPLFPQYASATTGSVTAKVMEIIQKWNITPSIEFINSYHDHQYFINSFTKKVAKDLNQYRPDHVLFSYHGIPERHLINIQQEQGDNCSWPSCGCGNRQVDRPYCYRSACFKTSELIAQELNLDPNQYSTSFQSRLGKDPWIKPYTDKTITYLAESGVKNLLVVSPSFVADCLETTLEIGEEYQDLFMNHGGLQFHFTESLNDDDEWAHSIYRIIHKNEFKNQFADKSFPLPVLR